MPICTSRYGVVSIWVGWSGVRLRAKASYFSLLQNFKTGIWVRPASCSLGTIVIFPEVKLPEREVNRICLLPKSEWVELYFSSLCMSSWCKPWRLYIPLTLICADSLKTGFSFQLSSLIHVIGNRNLVWWLRIPSVVAEKNHGTLHSQPNAKVSHAESKTAVTAIAPDKTPKPQRKVAGTTSFRH